MEGDLAGLITGGVIPPGLSVSVLEMVATGGTVGGATGVGATTAGGAVALTAGPLSDRWVGMSSREGMMPFSPSESGVLW